MYNTTTTIYATIAIIMAMAIADIAQVQGEYREGYLAEEVDRGQNCQYRSLVESLKWEQMENKKIKEEMTMMKMKMEMMQHQDEAMRMTMKEDGMKKKRLTDKIQELHDILIAIGVLCGGLLNFVAYIGYKYCKKGPPHPQPTQPEDPVISSAPLFQALMPPPPQFRSGAPQAPEVQHQPPAVPLPHPIPAPRRQHLEV